jgi:hypothetical protein
MRLLLVALLAAGLLPACAPAFAENGALKIVFIDVEQGDSALIILPNEKIMLIDGGRAEPRSNRAVDPARARRHQN